MGHYYAIFPAPWFACHLTCVKVDWNVLLLLLICLCGEHILDAQQIWPSFAGQFHRHTVCLINYISVIFHPIDLKFWTNNHIDVLYKIMTSKTGNVMIHFLLNWFSFPVFAKLELTISQPFLIQLIWNFKQIPTYMDPTR